MKVRLKLIKKSKNFKINLAFFLYYFTDVSAGNSGDMFVWMSKEHLCVLVYVVTVMHSMQAGYMDKAQKYTEKAFLQIEKLKREYPSYAMK